MDSQVMLASRRQWLISTAGLALAAGCRDSQTGTTKANKDKPADERPLRVLVVDQPAIAKQIDRFWRAQTDAPFELKESTTEQVLGAKRLAADVVLYPSQLLGSLAELQWLAPLSKELLDDETFKRRDLLLHARTTEVQWGAETLAVCLGSPCYVLYYRADLCERLGLKPPQTWAEYATLCAALADRSRLGDAVTAAADAWSPVIEPLAKGWAGKTLLARAASYARHPSEHASLFDLQTMQPLIGEPPFVKALEELVAIQKLASSGGRAPVLATPEKARAAIYAGRCGLAWSWPTAAWEPQEEVASALAANIAIAELPGAAEVFNLRTKLWGEHANGETQRVPLLGLAGCLGSVTMAARQPRGAENFLVWLSGGDEAVRIFAASRETTMFRLRQLATPTQWCEAALSTEAASQYAEVVKRTNEQGLVLVSPRLPGALEYLAALDDGVLAAVNQGEAPAAALASVAERFKAITQTRGTVDQRRAYHRSLGLDTL